MKSISSLIPVFLLVTVSWPGAADEIKTVEIGGAVVVYDYQPAREDVVTLTLNGLVTETNDSLRGLRNTDRRRLSKLGELIYQCKLLLYKPDIKDPGINANTPILISRNYSLFTGVDLTTAVGERVGIRVQALQPVDEDSLFSSALGGKDVLKEAWESLGEGSALNLKQLTVNVLKETDVIEAAESIDIIIRFPIFQMDKSVRQWRYNFKLKDFKQAVRHIDDNCTPRRFVELIDQQS
ncbi:MAG: hypothetical protein OEO19_14925 [Gammaproteobacteria bacterium]|nr:hypothetical protein [Gammaproteobacteria bacterium]MDH3449364.1 hypothetical protein [Gammaproteobacteria bacterium]